MIYALTNGIASAITGEWTDRKTGLVVVHPDPEGVELPFANDLYQTDCTTDKAVTPDSKYKSVMYMEWIRNPEIEQMGDIQKVSADVRLVVWLNGLKLGDKSPNLSGRVMNDLLRQFKGSFNVSGFSTVKVKPIAEEQKSPKLFTKYSKSASVNYYLSPYDYFSMVIRITAVANCGLFEADEPVC